MAAGLFNALSGAQRSSTVLDAIAHPNVLNPAAALGAAAQTAGTIYDVRQKQANAQLGQLYQQAIGPDGRFDPLKFQALIGQGGPGVAMAAGEGVRSGQELQGAQYNLANAQNGAINNAVSAALLESDPNKMKQAVVEQMRRLVAGGVIPQDLADHSLLNLSGDPATLRGQLETLRQQTLPSSEATQMIYGRPGTLDQGMGVVGTMQSPRTGALTLSGQQQPVYASPAVQGQLVKWTDTDGVEHTTTWTEANIARGNGRVTGPITPVSGAGGDGTPNAPNAPSPVNQPRLAPPGKPTTAAPAPAQPPAQPSQPAQPTPGLTDTTGPRPGSVAAKEQSANMYTAARADAGNFQARVWPLVQAAHILDTNAPVTGAGADAARSVIGHLQSMVNIFTPADIQSIGQAKFEELGKYLQQAVNSQPFAGSSNDKLAAAIAGNPSTHMSNLANNDVVKALIGLERMKLASYTDFDDTGQPPDQFANFQSKWARTHDPRAFMSDMLDDNKLKAMFAKMSPTERSAFAASNKIIGNHPEIMNKAAMP